MKIFLIRHGESMQNTLETVGKNIPDNMVLLTEKGKEQANEAGIKLKEYFEDNDIDLSKTIMYVSPFMRTRETANIINKYTNIKYVKEDFLLVEQSFGLFDNIPREELSKLYPKEYAYYEMMRNNGGKFYAKMPQGESRFDVAVRMRLFIESLNKDYRTGIENVVIVSHGMAIKCFLLAYLNKTPEWIDEEPNCLNGSIRLIDGPKDLGFINGDYKVKELKK